MRLFFLVAVLFKFTCLGLKFQPENANVTLRDIGYLNLTILFTTKQLDNFEFQVFRADSDVLDLSSGEKSTIINSTVFFPLKIQPKTLGRTSLVFYGHNSSNSTFRINEAFNITVVRGDENGDAGKFLEIISTSLILIAVGGCGAVVNGDIVLRLIRRPTCLGVALLCRFAFLPAVSMRVRAKESSLNHSFGLLDIL
ncbi:unnamed protein product [Dimorphilus gyrociliatus]|uniref:Uncharacterized protein n=1 Tax=Dimorphilus gyrociliatus TaxID=2664684 RepID=A0A7I8VM16_9ANNE|nr:unnamed protein product [Dimorphilus gyrociliatus]